jgi:hypothetical protein
MNGLAEMYALVLGALLLWATRALFIVVREMEYILLVRRSTGEPVRALDRPGLYWLGVSRPLRFEWSAYDHNGEAIRKAGDRLSLSGDSLRLPCVRARTSDAVAVTLQPTVLYRVADGFRCFFPSSTPAPGRSHARDDADVLARLADDVLHYTVVHAVCLSFARVATVAELTSAVAASLCAAGTDNGLSIDSVHFAVVEMEPIEPRAVAERMGWATAPPDPIRSRRGSAGSATASKNLKGPQARRLRGQQVRS